MALLRQTTECARNLVRFVKVKQYPTMWHAFYMVPNISGIGHHPEKVSDVHKMESRVPCLWRRELVVKRLRKEN